MSARGIVVSCPIERDGEILHTISDQLEPLELRRWALYWDKIDWPVNNVIHLVAQGDDFLLLADEDIFIRTEVRVTGGNELADALQLSHTNAYLAHARREPGAWAIAQWGDELVLPAGESQSAQIVEIELLRLLPTPAPDTPLKKVIKFKRKRSDELQRLRAALDDLYVAVADSGDPERAALAAKDEIESSVRDLDRVLGESFIDRFPSSVKVELNVRYAIVGAMAAQAIRVPLAIGAAVEAATGGLSVSITAGQRLAGLPEGTRDFAYLGYARQDLEAS